jgi:Fe-S cluster assembly iron-binding protein IscA
MDFNLTAIAKEKLMEYKEKNMPIKLKITGYSWCGATLGIVSEKQDENEKIYNVEGMDLIVSEDLDGAIKGAKIDYSNSFFKKGFEVIPTFS